MKKNITAAGILLLTGCSAGYDRETYQPYDSPYNEEQVINGIKGDYHNFPSIAAITAGDTKTLHCTGTLIKKDFLMTAAHCLTFYPAEYLTVIYGVNDLSEKEKTVRKVSSKSVHPSYFPYGEEEWKDLGLILLDEEIEESLPAPVLQKEYYDEVIKVGEEVTIAGYGQNSDLTYGILYYGQAPITEKKSLEMIVDGKTAHDPDLCFGDSGGPAYVMHQEDVYVTGVTSRLPDIGKQCGDGAIMTLPGGYLDWIEEEYRSMKEKLRRQPLDIDHGVKVTGKKETLAEEGCSSSGRGPHNWILMAWFWLATRNIRRKKIRRKR